MNSLTTSKTLTRLELSEQELQPAFNAHCEAFYRQGEILKRILRDREFADLGYTSFDQYMNERKPLGLMQRHAWRLINAMEVRKALPDIDCPSGQSAVWSEGCIRPLTHRAFCPADHKRLGKKIANRVAKGEKLTADLVKTICDKDRGVEQAKAEKAKVELKLSMTLTETVQDLRATMELWQKELATIPDCNWQQVSKTDRKDLESQARSFIEFLEAT